MFKTDESRVNINTKKDILSISLKSRDISRASGKSRQSYATVFESIEYAQVVR